MNSTLFGLIRKLNSERIPLVLRYLSFSILKATASDFMLDVSISAKVLYMVPVFTQMARYLVSSHWKLSLGRATVYLFVPGELPKDLFVSLLLVSCDPIDSLWFRISAKPVELSGSPLMFACAGFCNENANLSRWSLSLSGKSAYRSAPQSYSLSALISNEDPDVMILNQSS